MELGSLVGVVNEQRIESFHKNLKQDFRFMSR
jgi:hypothetical protein